MFSISKKDKEYIVKTEKMQKGEKATCNEDSLEIEKVDKETFVLNVSKGSMKKVR